MVDMCDKMNDGKMVFVCGDFNVDLLNPNNIKNQDFTDTKYSVSLFHTVRKPTSITIDSASRVVSGLLLNDVSHLPIFATLQNKFNDNIKLYNII